MIAQWQLFKTPVEYWLAESGHDVIQWWLKIQLQISRGMKYTKFQLNSLSVPKKQLFEHNSSFIGVE